jgi:hypothetical protein
MNKASSPEARALAIQERTLGGFEIFKTVGWRINLVPRSLLKSTGDESNIRPQRQSLTSLYSSYKEKILHQLTSSPPVKQWRSLNKINKGPKHSW